MTWAIMNAVPPPSIKPNVKLPSEPSSTPVELKITPVIMPAIKVTSTSTA